MWCSMSLTCITIIFIFIFILLFLINLSYFRKEFYAFSHEILFRCLLQSIRCALWGDQNFEAFVNYCAFSKYSGDKVEVSDLVYEGPDHGIDGAFYFRRQSHFSTEELQEIFQNSRREFQVSLVFTQAKSSEKWSKQEIDSYIASIRDYLSPAPQQPHSEYLADFKKCSTWYLLISAESKWPSRLIRIFFSAAQNTEAREIKAAFASGEKA